VKRSSTNIPISEKNSNLCKLFTAKLTETDMKTSEIMARLQAKYPGESEYLQAVQEVLESVEEVYNQHPKFERAKIVERMVEQGIV